MKKISPPAPPYVGPAKFHGGAQNLTPLKRIVIHWHRFSLRGWWRAEHRGLLPQQGHEPFLGSLRCGPAGSGAGGGRSPGGVPRAPERQHHRHRALRPGDGPCRPVGRREPHRHAEALGGYDGSALPRLRCARPSPRSRAAQARHARDHRPRRCIERLARDHPHRPRSGIPVGCVHRDGQQRDQEALRQVADREAQASQASGTGAHGRNAAHALRHRQHQEPPEPHAR
jgi:hypothetical protein